MTLVSSEDVDAPLESSASAVSWGPIIAGALAAASATIILVLLGSGLGLSVISPWSTAGVSATTFAVSAAVWLVVVQWLSSALGVWVGVHDDEVYFRDTAHGFLAWALATMLVAFILGSGAWSAIGGSVHAASTIAAGAASGASAGAAGQDGENGAANEATAYFVDALFRTASPATAGVQTPDTAAAATGEALAVIMHAMLRTGELFNPHGGTPAAA